MIVAKENQKNHQSGKRIKFIQKSLKDLKKGSEISKNITGDFEEMEKQKKSVRNRVTNEKEIDMKKIQNYITDWENN